MWRVHGAGVGLSRVGWLRSPRGFGPKLHSRSVKCDLTSPRARRYASLENVRRCNQDVDQDRPGCTAIIERCHRQWPQRGAGIHSEGRQHDSVICSQWGLNRMRGAACSLHSSCAAPRIPKYTHARREHHAKRLFQELCFQSWIRASRRGRDGQKEADSQGMRTQVVGLCFAGAAI